MSNKVVASVSKGYLSTIRFVVICLAVPSIMEAYSYIEGGIAYGRSSTLIYHRAEDSFSFWFAFCREIAYAVLPIYFAFFHLRESSSGEERDDE